MRVSERKVSQEAAAVGREKGRAKARGWRKCGGPEAGVAAVKERVRGWSRRGRQRQRQGPCAMGHF